MAAAATLVLKNNAAVDVNYYPVIIKTGEYARYVDRTSGVLNLQSTASLAYSETEKYRKVSGVVAWPVNNATLGVVENDYGRFEYTIHKSHAASDRLDVRKRLQAMIIDPIVTAAVDSGETPW